MAELTVTKPQYVTMGDQKPPLEVRPMPDAPSTDFRGLLRWAGPSIILGALAVGGFEAYHAGYMGAKGFAAIFWIYLISSVCQLFLNQEIARWTMATGETMLQGFCRLRGHRGIAWFTAVLAFFQTGWPAWIAGAAAGAAALFGGMYQVWAMIAIGLVFLLFAGSSVVYGTLEKLMMVSFVVATAGVVVLSIMMSTPQVAMDMTAGWLAFGVIPAGITIAAVGPFLNQPAGGFWNFWHTYWVRERQMGMASYMGRVTGLTSTPETISRTGYIFDTKNPAEVKKFRGWLRLNNITLIVFFLILGGLLFTFFVSMAGYSATKLYGMELPSGWKVAVVMASIFQSAFGQWAFMLFAVIIVFALFDSQFSIYDGIARMFADVAYIEHPDSLGKKSYRFWYFVVLGVLVVFGCIAVWMDTPYILWLASNWLGQFAQAFLTVMILIVNRKMLPKEIRPGMIATGINSVWALVLLSYFTVWTLFGNPFAP